MRQNPFVLFLLIVSLYMCTSAWAEESARAAAYRQDPGYFRGVIRTPPPLPQVDERYWRRPAETPRTGEGGSLLHNPLAYAPPTVPRTGEARVARVAYTPRSYTRPGGEFGEWLKGLEMASPGILSGDCAKLLGITVKGGDLAIAKQIYLAYGAIIEREAEAHGISCFVVIALIAAESGGNPHARSPTNAQGLMQVVPGTQRIVGMTNPWDPADNIHGGVKYLADYCGLRGKLFLPESIGKYHDGPATLNFSSAAQAHISKVTRIFDKIFRRQ